MGISPFDTQADIDARHAVYEVPSSRFIIALLRGNADEAASRGDVTLARDLRDEADRMALDEAWSSTCDICGQSRDLHVGLRPETNEPWCPNDDGTSFVPSDVYACMSPETHEVGCDCRYGICD